MFSSLTSGASVFPADTIAPDMKKTVCIAGHREKSVIPYNNDPLYYNITVAAVKLMLYRYIDMAVESGYKNFISGLAAGADLWGADYIIKKKQKNSDIKLIGAMPYLRHAERFPKEYRKILADVEKNADFLVTVSADPDIIYGKNEKQTASLYRDRNYFMIDNSSAVIAFFNCGESFSGTSQTLNYAIRMNRKIVSFSNSDVYRIMDKAGVDVRKIGRELTFLKSVF